MGEIEQVVSARLERRIRFQDERARAPRASHIPLARARRWRAPFENGYRPAVQLFVTAKAYVRFCAHAGSDLENEVGGALVGTWRVDRRSGEHFVVVEGVLRAPYTRHGRAHLTFTQDSLVGLHEALEEHYPGKTFVGWYHTHPRMGVFLSGYDSWLHEHFFPDPWQVALVIDPWSAEGGFFARQQDGWLDPRRYFGFLELPSLQGESVVHWRNVTPAPVEGG
ncbi:MAG: Mov34/MPN/PAD-1 family protein [Chloroflexota bacterium]